MITWPRLVGDGTPIAIVNGHKQGRIDKLLPWQCRSKMRLPFGHHYLKLCDNI
jgi:hypothetical protein